MRDQEKLECEIKLKCLLCCSALKEDISFIFFVTSESGLYKSLPEELYGSAKRELFFLQTRNYYYENYSW